MFCISATNADCVPFICYCLAGLGYGFYPRQHVAPFVYSLFHIPFNMVACRSSVVLPTSIDRRIKRIIITFVTLHIAQWTKFPIWFGLITIFKLLRNFSLFDG